MKKLILLSGILLINNLIYGQTETPAKEIERAPIVQQKNAEFPGAISNFREEFSKNLNLKNVKKKGVYRTNITFTVERDGSLVEIKASGENEELNNAAVEAVSRIKTKWSPAELNHIQIRSRFRLPITINVE